MRGKERRVLSVRSGDHQSGGHCIPRPLMLGRIGHDGLDTQKTERGEIDEWEDVLSKFPAARYHRVWVGCRCSRCIRRLRAWSREPENRIMGSADDKYRLLAAHR